MTMATAEKLYTGGYISYPRTETNIFPKELDLTPLVQVLKSIDSIHVENEMTLSDLYL